MAKIKKPDDKPLKEFVTYQQHRSCHPDFERNVKACKNVMYLYENCQPNIKDPDFMEKGGFTLYFEMAQFKEGWVPNIFWVCQKHPKGSTKQDIAIPFEIHKPFDELMNDLIHMQVLIYKYINGKKTLGVHNAKWRNNNINC